MLENSGATSDEISGPMPGDDLFEGPAVVGTRAIDIGAEPSLVFDFLAQMGFNRAGWYSYDLLDNLGRKSATSINQDWLVTSPGELVPGGPLDFVAAVVERPLAYVLQLPRRQALGHSVEFTLAYRLEPIDSGTRLVSRVRLAVDGPAGLPLSKALLIGDGLMVRRQLRGLQERC